MVVKLEQVGQLVKQDGAGFGHDHLLYSNLCENIISKFIRFKAERFTLSETSLSFTLSGLQTPSVMWPTTSCKLSSTPEARSHSNIRVTKSRRRRTGNRSLAGFGLKTITRLQAIKVGSAKRKTIYIITSYMYYLT